MLLKNVIKNYREEKSVEQLSKTLPTCFRRKKYIASKIVIRFPLKCYYVIVLHSSCQKKKNGDFFSILTLVYVS